MEVLAPEAGRFPWHITGPSTASPSRSTTIPISCLSTKRRSPDTTVYHVTTDVICDPESFSALAHHIARIHNIELPHDFDELIYSRRLMLHMLFGADPSTFARVYITKDAA